MQATRLSRPFVGSKAPVFSRQAVRVSASAVAAPASIPKKAVDGSDKGSSSLALKVADPETANGLVHRYMVLVQQNARRVSIRSSGVGAPGRHTLDWWLQI